MKEKIREAIRILQECLDGYEGEESEEGAETSEESYDDSTDSAPMSGGSDKVKMAAALMRRGK